MTDANGWVTVLKKAKAAGLTTNFELVMIEPRRLAGIMRPCLAHLDYLIVKLSVPFEHHGGWIRLTPGGDGTHVDWRSSYTVPTPLVGRLQEVIWKRMLVRGSAVCSRTSSG